ncbi:MAG: hypothetical protein JKY42_09530 [Flavobacteriales bacterium]|nr:hypothetical protein [Flavobacteriales bacterium]
MKRILTTAILTLCIGVFAFAQSGNNDGQIIGKAKSAIKSSCPDTTGKLQASVNVISACFFEGFITEVTFYKTPNCPPNQLCIQVIYTVGTVTLDCDNNVIGVSCGTAVAQ